MIGHAPDATLWQAHALYSSAPIDAGRVEASVSPPRLAAEKVSANNVGPAVRVLRIKEVVKRTGLSRSTVYVLMKTDPTFPKKVGLSARTTGVIEHQLEAWIASRACK